MAATGNQITTLGGGCFWCIEAVFSRIDGIARATSGYAGGSTSNPSYEQVCTGTTGHAEVVQVEFDPEVISYADLLRLFFRAHNPTTLNRQGADVGTQYRSVIFYHDEQQLQEAKTVIAEVQEKWGDPIVTELEPAPTFFPAEEYHQRYFERNPYAGYCQAVIAPKIKKMAL